jgi:hypothetical protein
MKCRDRSLAVDQPACFSQSGSDLDLWAPGAFVSAGPWAGGYGTSAAAPFVAGPALLLRQAAPTARVGEIQRAIKSSGPVVGDSRPKAALQRHRLDIPRAIRTIQSIA